MIKTLVQYLFNENVIVYLFAGLLGLGLLIRIILERVYIHTVKESDNLGVAKRKSLKHMKMKFEACYKLKIGVNNVDIFVDKNVLGFRFCGVMLSTWENFSGQVLLLNFLIVPICAVFGVYYECGQDQILTAGGVGILSASILVLVDKMINLPFKKQILRVNIIDYLENFYKVRLEQEIYHPEILEQYRKEYLQTVTEETELGSFSTQGKEATKKEINRRKEARLRKEEEKKIQIHQREEEQKRIQQARRDEEQKRAEERRMLAAKRREDELRKMQEEQEIIDLRKTELKKKSEEKSSKAFTTDMNKNSSVEPPLGKSHEEEKLQLLRRIEEELLNAKRQEKVPYTLGLEEVAVAKELIPPVMDQVAKVEEHMEQTIKSKPLTTQEEKLIEDILKEFFA